MLKLFALPKLSIDQEKSAILVADDICRVLRDGFYPQCIIINVI